MTPRGERIVSLASTLVNSDVRQEAAMSHIESIRAVAEITGTRLGFDNHHSFLAGWDAAMELKFDELHNENSELHSMVLDLCHRLCVRRCETCHGVACDFTPQCGPCPDCDGGWVDVPPGEAEKIVDEIKHGRPTP